jgi:hypothetical protein
MRSSLGDVTPDEFVRVDVANELLQSLKVLGARFCLIVILKKRYSHESVNINGNWWMTKQDSRVRARPAR